MNFDYSLLAKYVLGKLTPEEMEYVMLWKNTNEKNNNLFSEIQRLKIAHNYNFYKSPERIDAALKKINKKIEKKSYKTFGANVIKYAAAVIFILIVSVYSWNRLSPESYTTITVDENSDVKKVLLDDGTLVWLNKSSVLRIPESFSEKNRKIEVKGEVYFDVKKNLDSPFIVSTDYLNVKALGTSFNVKTAEHDEIVETVLVSGKVVLQDKNAKEILELSPGEKVTYSYKQNEYSVENVDANINTAWHLDQLKFEKVTLREIANKISLIYDVNVNLESKILADKRLRCVVNKDESLEEVLNQLRYIMDFEYKIDENEIFIIE